MQKISLLALFFSLVLGLSAQKPITISGNVKDEKTGELLIGATVTTQELPDLGAFSNDYGFYSLSLPSGTYTFVVQYLGYQDLVPVLQEFLS